jgi:lysozyme family protein
MTAANYEPSIRKTLKWEGGYVNDPRDPGGETNYGITAAVARAAGYTGSMRSIPMATVMDIYRTRYAKPVLFDAHKAGVDYSLLDYGVNSGVGRANKVARRVCGLPDNAPAAELLTAINKRDPKAVVSSINAERLKFLQGLSTWHTFGKGWGNRVQGVNAAALVMAGSTTVLAPDVTHEAAPGKGEVPKPKTTGAITGTASGGAVGSGFGLGDWISAHPFYSVLIAAAALVAIVAVAEFLAHRWKAAKQEAPTPGLVPVPELQT